MGEIITKSNIGRQQLTPEQTKVAIGVFYEVCFGQIPEHRLNDCYLHVKRNRTTTFELMPEEMCAAWNEIRQSEMHKRTNQKQLTHGFCAKCNNTGTAIKRDDRGIVTDVRRCSH